MDDEIDLRPYIQAVMSRWYWVVGLTILAAVAAYLITRLITPTYEATSLVAITEARERVQFDPRFQAINENNPLEAYPELALSDAVVASLIEQVQLPGVDTTKQMRSHLAARSGNDPSLLRFTATYTNPQMAAQLSAAWAELFVTYANDLYSDQGGEQLRIFGEQLVLAEEELAVAEQALIEFQGGSRLAIAQNELQALIEAQALSLSDRRSLGALLQSVQGLQNQLAEQSGATVSAGDQLAALILQLKSFGLNNSRFSSSSEAGVTSREEQLPVQLQLDLETALVSDNRADLVASLGDLTRTLGTLSAQVEDDLEALEPEILRLQGMVQELEVAQERLTRNRDVAAETTTALAYKVEEERITTQDTSSGVRLASGAAAPSDPANPQTGLIVIVAALLGFLLSIFLILVTAWWQQGKQRAEIVTTENGV